MAGRFKNVRTRDILRHVSLLAIIFFVLNFKTAQAQTTVSVAGTLQDPSGAPIVSNGTFVRFSLRNFGGQIPGAPGIPAVVGWPDKDFTPDGSGNISGTIITNQAITAPNGTFYHVCIWYRNQLFRCNDYVINSAFDLNSTPPLNIAPNIGPGFNVLPCFVFQKPTTGLTWTITHNLNDLNTFVETADLNGILIFPPVGGINLSNPNVAVITWSSPQAGRAMVCHSTQLNIATNQPDAIVSHPLAPQTIHTQPLSIDTLTPGNCVQAGTGGLLTTISSGCATASTMDTIPNGGNFVKHSWVGGPLPVVYNGDFEDFPGVTPILPPPDWDPNPNMICSYETVTPYEGLRSLKCIANTAGSGAGVFTFSIIPVVPGETFYIQGAVKTDGVVTANVVLRWARADGQSTTNFPGDALIASSTSGSWTVISATGVAPSNAVTANIELISTPFGVAGTTWFDSISAYRVSYPGPISAPTLTATGLTPGNCVQAGTGGLLTTTGVGCGGGGTVTSISDGGFAPLFTTNVANPTTTPAITNTAINQYANTFLAGPSGTATDLVDFSIVNATGTASPMSITATPKQSGDIAMVFTVQDSNNDGSFAPDVSWTASTLNTSLQKYYYKVVSGLATATASGTIGSAHPNWAATEALFTAKPTFTPAVTNQANINSGACNFTNQAIGFTPTAGRTLIVAVMSGYTSFFGGPVNVTSLTDSVGDVFAPLSQITNSTGRGTEITLLAAYNIVGGATTFSCSQSGGMSNGTVDLFEVSNIAPVNPLIAPMTVRRILATDLPPTVTFTNKNLAGNVTVNANTLTLIDSMTVHFPSSGGPWRAFLAYDYYFNGGVNGECYLTDGTTLQMLVESQPLNNSSSCQMGALSKATYADGSVVTFSVYTYDTGATTVNASGGRNVTVPSYMQVGVLSSN